MAIIYTYPPKKDINLSDSFLITDSAEDNNTKTLLYSALIKSINESITPFDPSQLQKQVDENFLNIQSLQTEVSEPTVSVQTLTLNATDDTTTSVAIYGVNLINSATFTDLATKLPQPTTGRQTIFVNNSNMPIKVYPSNPGGEINGVVDDYALIPNDGRAYLFFCTENPLPGAWTWSPPAVNQIQLPRISIPHVNMTGTGAYGVGKPGASLLNPGGQNWYDNLSITGFPQLSFNVIASYPSPAPGQDYWATYPTLVTDRTITKIKVYSNFLASDAVVPSQVPTIGRYVAFQNTPNSYSNFTASGFNFQNALEVPAGPLNSPVQVGDVGTQYKLVNLSSNASTGETDLIGPNRYLTFLIGIPFTCATKTYDFDIFIEHT